MRTEQHIKLPSGRVARIGRSDLGWTAAYCGKQNIGGFDFTVREAGQPEVGSPTFDGAMFCLAAALSNVGRHEDSRALLEVVDAR